MADEQWNINTDALSVGDKLWHDGRWFVIVRLSSTSVWVRPEAGVNGTHPTQPLSKEGERE